MEEVNQLRLHFDQDSVLLLNICLGIVMFGVALAIKFEDFRQILYYPKAILVGLASQILLLPALTFILILILQPQPSIAMGMILVASCPGGNISNFMSLLSKGNVALSVSITAFSTLAALIVTPLNFALWGTLYNSSTQEVLKLSIDPLEIFQTILWIVGIPLVAGMWVTAKFPDLTRKIITPIKIISLVIFAGFIIGAFAANFDIFLHYIHYVLLVVFLHNTIAFAGGFYLGKAFSLSIPDTKAIAIETGIQNSGLALILIFNFYEGLGGMALVAGWWGIWDIISGLVFAWVLSLVKERQKVKY